jgi:hypothetical protein
MALIISSIDTFISDVIDGILDVQVATFIWVFESVKTLTPHNATLSGKKLLAKMLNGVKTANCFLSV